jgi:hypothetical protein
MLEHSKRNINRIEYIARFSCQTLRRASEKSSAFSNSNTEKMILLALQFRIGDEQHVSAALLWRPYDLSSESKFPKRIATSLTSVAIARKWFKIDKHSQSLRACWLSLIYLSPVPILNASNSQSAILDQAFCVRYG